MKLICDERAKTEVLDALQLTCIAVETVSLQGYTCCHLDNKLFYLQPASDQNFRDFLSVELSDSDLWELDKFQCFTCITKELLSPDTFFYVRRSDLSNPDQCVSLEQIIDYKQQALQLKQCDLCLLIPGKISKLSHWQALPRFQSEAFDIFHEQINFSVKTEYHTDFAAQLDRTCIGDVTVQIYIDRGLPTQYIYEQRALITLVRHESGFCILEILIQNCAVGGIKVLNHYCDNALTFLHNGQVYTADTLCQALNMERYGRQRSMAFVSNDTPDEQIINALANEEYPMGQIRGDFLKKVRSDNIAQYDTAEVFVSHETMLEKCRQLHFMGDQRLQYQAIEIFFVELILLQDAAVDKIYKDLQNESDNQRNFGDIKAATERCEQLSFDMAQALRFADYDQFRYPTVRLSAKNVAARFGIDIIYDKYKTSQDLLNAMITSNRRKIQERQETVENQFLLLLSALAAVGTLGEIFHVMYEDRVGGLFSYLSALAVVLIMYGLYKTISFLAKIIIHRILRKKKKE